MKKIGFLLLLLSYILGSNAQVSYFCLPDEMDEGNVREIPELTNGDCDPVLGGSWDVYKDMNMFIPNLDSMQPLHVPPIKTIRLNVNVIQNGDGTGNFENTEVFMSRLRTIINNVNTIYSHYAPSDPISWVEELPNYDSRIRFSIGDLGEERVYFYQDSTLWNMNSVSLAQTYILDNYPERLENINIYIFGNSNPANNHASAHSCNWTNLSENQYVVAHYWVAQADWGISLLLSHEFAHLLGLLHTYEGGHASAICDTDNPEFLKDVFLVAPPNTSNCPHQCDPHADPYEIIGDDITNNIVGGSTKEFYISPMQAGQMHRATSLTSVRKYITSEISNVPLTISDDQLWDFDMKLYQDLVIESGATLTLTCHLVMHPDAKIIVKRGGKLIVDGATIGTDIFEKRPWQGIEVWGDRNENQFIENGNYHQGFLELKNGATIENAICAVELWRPGYGGYTGGIIHANDVVFHNNSKAIRAMSYSNIDPITNQETNYNAYFQNCSFIIDQDFYGFPTFQCHVDMHSVKGISFAGCSFFSDRTIPGVGQYCIGITAFNTGFEVTYLPIGRNDSNPTPNYIPSSFSGFHTGIYSANTGLCANSFTVFRSVFNNNVYGITSKNNAFATIANNLFYIGDNSDCAYGVFADGVGHFCIENNRFSAVGNTSFNTYGIGVGNTFSNNDINLNVFENLSCANVAIGQNSNGWHNSTSRISGLTYSCNDNEANTIDFSIIGEENIISGIRCVQGSTDIPTGNTFSGSLYHFYNDGDYLIDYYYSNTLDQTPDLSKLYQINAICTNYSNDCMPHYGNNTTNRTAEEIDELEAKYTLAYQHYENLLQFYEGQIDDGNTDGLISMINEAHYDEREQIKSLLMEISPFLSEELLRVLAYREEVFDNQTLFEIISANPDVLKNNLFIDFLENKENPLPSEYIIQLKKMAYSATYRSELLSQIGVYYHDYIVAASDIVRNILFDTHTNTDTLCLWFDNMHDIIADRLSIASFLQNGDFSKAIELANLLPTRYDFQETNMLDHYNYLDLINLYQALYENGNTFFEMTESELEIVENIAERGSGYSQSMAEVILSEIQDTYAETYTCIELPYGRHDRNMMEFSKPQSYDINTFNVDVYPNPAGTWTRIIYKLPNDSEITKLYLTNSMGIKVLETELDGIEGQKVLDLNDLANGIYLYTVQHGLKIQSGKISIAK